MGWAVSAYTEQMFCSAITTTSVDVTLAEVAATAPVTADFAVTIGEEAVAVSNVALKAGTDKTYTLTVALAGKEGLVKVNGVEAAAASDYKAPELVSVANVNGNQLVVTFSEAVVNAAEVDNYTLRNTVTGKQTDLDKNTAATAVASADKKSVTITLSVAQIKEVGVDGLGTLDDVAYRLFVTQNSATGKKIADKAENVLAANSYKQFSGAIGADNTPPVLQTATLDLEAGTLALAFNEAVTVADITKVSITDGTTTKAFTTSDTPAGTTTITVTLSAATKTAIEALSGNLTVTLAAGAVKDTATNANAAVTMAVDNAVYALLQSATWDENTNKLTLVFDQVIDMTKFTNFGAVTLKGATNQTLTALKATVATVGNSATIEFQANDVTNIQAFQGAGDAPATPKISITTGTFKTLAGKDNKTVTDAALTYVNDAVKPVINSAAYDAGTSRLQLVFSKPVLMDVAKFKVANAVAFFDKSSDTVAKGDLSNTAAQGDMFKSNAPTATAYANTDYATEVWVNLHATDKGKLDGADAATLKARLAASVLVDKNLNANDAYTKDTQIPVSIANTGTITINVANHSERLIKVSFDKDMDRSTVTKDKFTVVNASNPNNTKAVQSVIATSDKKVFFLDLGTVAANQLAVGTVYDVSYAAGMNDAYGETVAAGKKQITGAADANNNDVAAASAITFVNVNGEPGIQAGDKIVLTYAEPVTVEVDAATFRAANTTLGGAATIAVGEYKNQVEITFAGTGITFALDPGDSSKDQLNIAVSDIKDYAGNELNAAETSYVAFPAEASIPAQDGDITAVDVDGDGVLSVGDQIIIPFDQTLLTGTTLANIVLQNANIATTFDAAVDGKNVVLTMTAVHPDDVLWHLDLAAAGNTVDITALASEIKNLWGREITVGVSKAVTLNQTVASKPTLISAAYAAGKLYVTFSEPVSLVGVSALAKTFAITDGTLPTDATAAIVVPDTGSKTIELSLTGAAIDPGLSKLNIIAGGAAADPTADLAIVDFDGNQAKRVDTTGVVIAEYVAN